MKIKELQKLLNNLPEETEVLIPSGQSYKPVSATVCTALKKDSIWTFGEKSGVIVLVIKPK